MLGIDLASVYQVVLSHGHPDHFGGIYAALGAIGRRVPLVVHPSAFLPRSIRRPDIMIQYFNRGLTERELTEAGAGVIAVREPMDLAPGVATSGEVGVSVDFEQEVPVGRVSVRDGHVGPDPIEDYMTLWSTSPASGSWCSTRAGTPGCSAPSTTPAPSPETSASTAYGRVPPRPRRITPEKIARTVDGLADGGRASSPRCTAAGSPPSAPSPGGCRTPSRS